MGTIVYFVACLLVGFGIGWLGANVTRRRKPVGVLRIDTSDPGEGAYMFLELTTSVEAVSKRKAVLLKVRNESYISRN